ncbi:MAG TPA: hypothetical protein VFA20_29595 [Myxococcaceae bacterium]|nr:hypothetical protein [Myxococcaceae bacterium]
MLLLAACGGASIDPGLEAAFRVPGAQYVPGEMEDDSGGPSAATLYLSRSQVPAGTRSLLVSGSLEPAAGGVLLGLDGDRGHWVMPAGPPDPTVPDLLTFTARADLSPLAEVRTWTLRVRATGADGRAGPALETELNVLPAGALGGELVFSLAWDTDADLDLHVVDPAGNEVWARNINSWQPPPPGAPPPPPDAWLAGGVLDFDSNAGCVIDGRRRENVVWARPPPSGHYRVLVDTPSLCGAGAAIWTVEARLRGELVARAEGESTETSTLPPHDRGAGVLALEIDVP